MPLRIPKLYIFLKLETDEIYCYKSYPKIVKIFLSKIPIKCEKTLFFSYIYKYKIINNEIN